MSLHNLLVVNNNDIYCRDLNVAGDLTVAGDIIEDNFNVTGTLTMENGSLLDFVPGSNIGGTPNFNGTSVTNFVGGSRIEGQLNVGNGANIILSGGTTLTSGSTIASNGILNINGPENITSTGTLVSDLGSTVEFDGSVIYGSTSTVTIDKDTNLTLPTITVTLNPFWFDENTFTAIAATPPSMSVVFIKIGKNVTVYIPGFLYTAIGNQGYFYVSWTGVDAAYLPNKRYLMSCPVENNGVTASGYVYANTSNNRFEIRLSGVNINDHFSGSIGLEQGLGASFTLSAGNIISFTYQTA